MCVHIHTQQTKNTFRFCFAAFYHLCLLIFSPAIKVRSVTIYNIHNAILLSLNCPPCIFLFYVYCINLWWPNIIIQDLGIYFDRGVFSSLSLLIHGHSPAPSSIPRHCYVPSFPKILSLSVFCYLDGMTQGFNISWPSTDPGTETGRECCFCSFPNKHSLIPCCRSSAGEARTERQASLDVDADGHPSHCGNAIGCQFLLGQLNEMVISSCVRDVLLLSILPAHTAVSLWLSTFIWFLFYLSNASSRVFLLNGKCYSSYRILRITGKILQ